MVRDDGEHTRFPCLATVRSLVATVVTVLAVAVVVLVIGVFNRPEDISLSISGGYIQSKKPWWTDMLETMIVAQSALGKYHMDKDDPVITPTIGSAFFYPPTPPVKLRVRWSAYNPSGRAPIECNVTAIRVHDMPITSSAYTRMEIGSVSLEKPLLFSVPPKASHTDTELVDIYNNTLQYIFDQYGGSSSFGAMVQVTATITSETRLSTSATDSIVNYYCWPVTVVYGTPDETAHGDVTCRKDSPANISSPAPAPAPAGDAAELPAGITYLHG